MRISLRLVSCTLFAALEVACLNDLGGTSSTSSSSGSSTVDAGDSGASAAGQACLDTADAFANAQVRCGFGDYTSERAAVISSLANGDCNSVSIRNETELRTMCFPSLASISCSDLSNMLFDPSCAEQIIRNK